MSAGYTYDFAGNLKTDAAGHSYDYDAENMQVKYDTTAAQYFYDGEGRRVKSVTNNGTLTTLFVYDAMGKMLAEYTSTNPTGGGTSYLTTDALGSTRIVTGTNPSAPVKARHDYLPFGEEISGPFGGRTAGQGYVADNVRQKFTGQQRDLKTGLDYFGARYYSSAIGRFTSADSVLGNRANPQSMNLYSYVLNNPLVMVDPTGHEGISASQYDGTDDKLRQLEEEERANEEANAKAIESEYQKAYQDAVAKIDQAVRDGKGIVLLVAGVDNDTLANTQGAQLEVMGTREIAQGREVAVAINGETAFGARGGDPHKQTANLARDILNYALKQGIAPEQITLVAHSNGVPSLGQALSGVNLPAGHRFRSAYLFAPATQDVKLIAAIANNVSKGTLMQSDSDSALKAGRLPLPSVHASRKVSEFASEAPKSFSNISVLRSWGKNHNSPERCGGGETSSRLHQHEQRSGL